MNHARHVIREAIVAVLAAAGTQAHTRVFDTPTDPRTVFPALTVETDAELQDVQPSFHTVATRPNRLVQRMLRLEISAEVQHNTNYARTRDQLCAEVEAALASASITGVKAITPTGFRADFYKSGEHPIAVGRQTFDVEYSTRQGTPATTTT